MTIPASPSSAGDETLPHGHSDVEQIQTKNNMGFDMGKPSYRADTWWKAYNPVHPEVGMEGEGQGMEGVDCFSQRWLFHCAGG